MLKQFRDTAISGLLFLIPITLMLFVVLKLYEVLLFIAKPLDGIISLEKMGGVTLANIIMIAFIMIICYLAGLLARGKRMKQVEGWIEGNVLIRIPGYAVVKGFTNDLLTTEKASKDFTPVLVTFDDQQQLCFEIERLSGKKVVIYVPGAPSPWSGAVVYVDEERVIPLDITVSEATKNIQRLGMQSQNLIP